MLQGLLCPHSRLSPSYLALILCAIAAKVGKEPEADTENSNILVSKALAGYDTTMTQIKKYWPRMVILVMGVISVTIFAWVFSAEWRYRNFPNTCPFSVYLPKGAEVIKCEYVGVVDFTVDFQAKGTLSDMDIFIQGVRDNLTNAKTNAGGGALITGTDLTSKTQIQISSDYGILVDFEWVDGIISMFYHDG
ncbi:MAG: hypothetical protein V7695_23175 [Sulfitobacter sp.]